MKNNIYVVRASHMLPVLSAAKAHQLDLDCLLEKVGLTQQVFCTPDNLVLEAPLWHFFEIAAKALNIDHFGFLVTQNIMLDQYGAFGEQICSAVNLKQALDIFIHNSSQHVNYKNYWLEDEDNDYIWLCRKGTPKIERGKWQVEQHVISFIIELIRFHVGRDWYPKKIRFCADQITGVEHADFYQRSALESSHLYGSILIEKSLLLDNPIGREKNNKPLLSDIPDKLPDILMMLMIQGYFGEEILLTKVANALEITPRTLQRRLAKHNTDFRELASLAKFKRAQVLLKNSKTSINEISNSLGYANTTNFIRAFKKLASVSPAMYRKEPKSSD